MGVTYKAFDCLPSNLVIIYRLQILCGQTETAEPEAVSLFDNYSGFISTLVSGTFSECFFIFDNPLLLGIIEQQHVGSIWLEFNLKGPQVPITFCNNLGCAPNLFCEIIIGTLQHRVVVVYYSVARAAAGETSAPPPHELFTIACANYHRIGGNLTKLYHPHDPLLES